jgi:hypothetical protein
LIALLDAVLVNGYGSKTAAGWTKPLSTTNKAAYLQNLTGANNSSGMLLYIDDTGPGAGGAREARTCGFETMSAITPTGTGQFPTAAQSTIGVGTLTIRKSTTADATARPWTIIANGQTIYLFIETGDQTIPLGAVPFFFGDFKSYKSADQYAVAIIGRATENNGTPQNEPFHMVGALSNLNIKYMGHYVARSWNGIGGSTQFGKIMDYNKIGTTPIMQYSSDNQLLIPNNGTLNFTMGRNASSIQFPGPNGVDGALWVSPLYMFHGFSYRGYLPGLWAPLHDRVMLHNDTMTLSSGNLSGKSLICQQTMAYLLGSGDIATPLIEYSDTWT